MVQTFNCVGCQIQYLPVPRRLAMWMCRIFRFLYPLSITAALVGSASAQTTVKIRMVMPLTGTLAAAGKQVVAGARLYLAQHGDTVAGKRIELVVKDDGSS